MTGLLRRLASQTLRTGPPEVRPLARLIHLGPYALTQEPVGVAEPEPAAVLPPGPGRAPGKVERTPPRPVTLGVPDRAAQGGRHELHGERERAAATDSRDGADPPRDVDRPTEHAAGDEPAFAAHGSSPAADVTRPHMPLSRSTWELPPTAAGPARHPGQEPAPAFRPPAALVEESSRRMGDPPTRPAELEAGPSSDRRRPDAEPAEVHVHIGRIEVTAVHEPPPAPRKQHPSRQPMSLEEYLAKRRGRTG